MSKMIWLLLLSFSTLCFPAYAIPIQIETLLEHGSSRPTNLRINNNGNIAITYHPQTSGAQYSFLMKTDGGLTPVGTVYGSNSTFATDINDTNTIVGYGANVNGRWLAYGWTKASVLQTLVNGTGSWANAINNNGVVAGYTEYNTSVEQQASLWLPTGQHSNIGLLSPNRSYALAINNLNSVVGYTHGTDLMSEAAVLWSNSGDIQYLSNPHNYNQTRALAINDHGQVAGYAGNHPATQYACYWTLSGEFTFIPMPAGVATSRAVGVNNAGLVIGEMTLTDNRVFGFVWDAVDGLNILPTYGGNYTSPQDINDNGQIIGIAQDFEGNFKSVVWTVVPEPSSLLVMFVMASPLIRFIKR